MIRRLLRSWLGITGLERRVGHMSDAIHENMKIDFEGCVRLQRQINKAVDIELELLTDLSLLRSRVDEFMLARRLDELKDAADKLGEAAENFKEEQSLTEGGA
jgi:hypothetical protein